MKFDPIDTYVHLKADGSACELPGGDAFWSKEEGELEEFGSGWLVSEFECDADWPSWEMHPASEEIVYLLSGNATMLLLQDNSVFEVQLVHRAAVIVPRGIWHTAKVVEPSRMLFVTMGRGTQQRPLRQSAA